MNLKFSTLQPVNNISTSHISLNTQLPVATHADNIQGEALPAYKPTPDYYAVMQERELSSHAYRPNTSQLEQLNRHINQGEASAQDPRYNRSSMCFSGPLQGLYIHIQ